MRDWRMNAAYENAPLISANQRNSSSHDFTAEPRIHIDTSTEDFQNGKFSWRQCWSFTGPGFLMSIAYVDPGNFESDLVAGAEFGYQLLWVLVWTTLLGFFVQELAVRLALATGRDLARCVRDEFPHKPTRIAMWAVTELAIVASDVPEVIGTAFALKIIFGWQLWIGILVSSTSAMLLLMLRAHGVRPLEVFFGGVITCLCICYVVELWLVQPPVGKVVQGLVIPIIANNRALFVLVSLLGAVCMPHNLYLHSALTLTRDIPTDAPPQTLKMALFYNKVESAIALLLSLFVNCAVVIVAAYFHDNAKPEDVERLQENPLMSAPGLLRNTLGSLASGAFAAALLASGQSSTVTGTYAGQFVMEGMLELRIPTALRAFLTRSFAIFPSLAVALIAGDSGAENLILISSVVLALQLPLALLPLLKLVSTPHVCGSMSIHGFKKNALNVIVFVVVFANVFLVTQSASDMGIFDFSVTGAKLAGKVIVALMCVLFIIAYLACVFQLWKRPVLSTGGGKLPTITSGESLHDNVASDDDNHNDNMNMNGGGSAAASDDHEQK